MAMQFCGICDRNVSDKNIVVIRLFGHTSHTFHSARLMVWHLCEMQPHALFVREFILNEHAEHALNQIQSILAVLLLLDLTAIRKLYVRALTN